MHRQRGSARRAWLLFLLLLLLLGHALRSGLLVVPEAWNPWAPLRIDAEPNLLTGWKLAHAIADRERCQAALAQAAMRYTALPDRTTGPGCGFDNAVRIERTSVAVGEAFSLSCRTAVSLAMWERHVLHPAAQTHFQQPIRAIEHFGSYACRNVYGREGGRRSQHATADALGIAGFVLADGSRIRVLGDWASTVDADGLDGTDAARAHFLRDVHRGACRYFDAVLGPEYNQAHADHFHFDRGGFRACR